MGRLLLSPVDHAPALTLWGCGGEWRAWLCCGARMGRSGGGVQGGGGSVGARFDVRMQVLMTLA